jgi:hypothetical protein
MRRLTSAGNGLGAKRASTSGETLPAPCPEYAPGTALVAGDTGAGAVGRGDDWAAVCGTAGGASGAQAVTHAASAPDRRVRSIARIRST